MILWNAALRRMESPSKSSSALRRFRFHESPGHRGPGMISVEGELDWCYHGHSLFSYAVLPDCLFPIGVSRIIYFCFLDFVQITLDARRAYHNSSFFMDYLRNFPFTFSLFPCGFCNCVDFQIPFLFPFICNCRSKPVPTFRIGTPKFLFYFSSHQRTLSPRKCPRITPWTWGTIRASEFQKSHNNLFWCVFLCLTQIQMSAISPKIVWKFSSFFPK